MMGLEPYVHSVLVPDMTYNVFGGMLNLAQSINQLRTQSFFSALTLLVGSFDP